MNPFRITDRMLNLIGAVNSWVWGQVFGHHICQSSFLMPSMEAVSSLCSPSHLESGSTDMLPAQ